MKIPKLSYSLLSSNQYDTIIDVRSPSEYEQDHVIGAINFPVLSDDERALVGITYKQDSRFKARKIGAALIARNTAQHLESVLFLKERNWKPLIYCWRGGQRSASFATILSEIGWRPHLIDGGYKDYRSCIIDFLHKEKIELNFTLISGHTGTAKTEILTNLKKLNLQVIDLEHLANHRGSVFGAHPSNQPSQKLFESYLFKELKSLNLKEPIFLEAESNKIGRLSIPSMVWNQMKSAPRIEITAPLNERAAYLTRTYKDLSLNPEILSRRIDFLISQQGYEKISRWQNFVETRKFSNLATELMFHHYDPRYQNSRTKLKNLKLASIDLKKLNSDDIIEASQKIKAIVDSSHLKN